MSFLVNEASKLRDVYFDDITVQQINSPVVEVQDYYPFGLKFNSYSRENSVPNTLKLFQGQEHFDDLGLNWDSFKYRNHMPDIGRFFNVDPLAAKYVYNSPYAFSENKVINGVELEGLEVVLLTELDVVQAMNPAPPPSGGQKVLGGVGNVIGGTAAAIGTGSAIAATDGGAIPLGAGAAFTLSLGQVAIGAAQIVDGAQEMATGKESSSSSTIQGSNNIPGLISTGSDSHDVIDAGAAVATSLMGSNLIPLKSFADLLKSKTVGEAVVNSVNVVNDVSDANALIKTAPENTPKVEAPKPVEKKD
jgi:RHS repeat-associated protein